MMNSQRYNLKIWDKRHHSRERYGLRLQNGFYISTISLLRNSSSFGCKKKDLQSPGTQRIWREKREPYKDPRGNKKNYERRDPNFSKKASVQHIRSFLRVEDPYAWKPTGWWTLTTQPLIELTFHNDTQSQYASSWEKRTSVRAQHYCKSENPWRCFRKSSLVAKSRNFLQLVMVVERVAEMSWNHEENHGTVGQENQELCESGLFAAEYVFILSSHYSSLLRDFLAPVTTTNWSLLQCLLFTFM